MCIPVDFHSTNVSQPPHEDDIVSTFYFSQLQPINKSVYEQINIFLQRQSWENI